MATRRSRRESTSARTHIRILDSQHGACIDALICAKAPRTAHDRPVPESGVRARRRPTGTRAEETRERRALQCNGINRRCRAQSRQVEEQHPCPHDGSVAKQGAITASGGRIIRKVWSTGARRVVRVHGAPGSHACHRGIDRHETGHRRHHHDQRHGGHSQPCHASMECCTTGHRLPLRFEDLPHRGSLTCPRSRQTAQPHDPCQLSAPTSNCYVITFQILD